MQNSSQIIDSAADSPLAGDIPRFGNLRNTGGVSWLEFRKQLQPRYLRLWLEAAVGYAMLTLGIATLIYLEPRMGLSGLIATTMVTAFWIGFWIHYAACFFHEGAHFNLLPTRTWNDVVSNCFFGIFMGLEIKVYRQSHWQHHLNLGKTTDPEFSYQEPFNGTNLFAELCGLTLIRTMFNYHGRRNSKGQASTAFAHKYALLGTALFQIIVIGSFFYWELEWTAIAWIVGNLLVFPFIARVRQSLEHRSTAGTSKTSWRLTDHRPVTRIFAKNWLSRTLGSAGFNRHLLHHWEPTISYTCFDKMESFLMATDIAPTLKQCQTGYFKTFLELTR